MLRLEMRRNTVYNSVVSTRHSILSEVDMHKDDFIREDLERVFNAMVKEGYDPIKQFSGFILSEDPTYIPVTDGARNIIRSHERDEMLAVFIKTYFEKD